MCLGQTGASLVSRHYHSDKQQRGEEDRETEEDRKTENERERKTGRQRTRERKPEREEGELADGKITSKTQKVQ